MHRHSILRWSGALAASALTMAACGSAADSGFAGTAPAATSADNSAAVGSQSSSTSSTKSGSTTDGCSLITQQEATAALGHDSGPPQPDADSFGGAGGITSRGCHYSPADGGVVTVIAMSGISRSLFDMSRSEAEAKSTSKFQDLPGVGDAAWLASDPQGGGCNVIKGSVLITIILGSSTPLASPVGSLTTLCRTATGRV